MAISPLLILIIGGALALIVLIIGIVISVSSDQSVVDERLEEIVAREGKGAIEAREEIQRTPLTNWINQRVAGSSWADKISVNLAQSDIKMKPGEYAALMLIAAFGVGVVLWFMGGQSILFGLIGAGIGLLLPGLYVKRERGKRLQNFNDQLGDMLSLMVNGLRAGYSTMQAMEAVSKELPSPICDEFRRVVQEMQLGVSMEDGLDNLMRRIPSEDLDLIITAINVQREVGGNLAVILDTISHTIRERVRIKGEIKTLTTQVMYSGRFLAMMPLAVMGLLFVLNRPYMMQFFNPDVNTKYPIPCGYCALILAATLIIAGYFAMNKLGDIEV
jgi:tight adherence protein B